LPVAVSPGILLVIRAGNAGTREAHVGNRRRRNDAQKRAAGRVRGRVQQRPAAKRGDARGGGDSRRKRNAIDLGAIESYANRLADRSGGTRGLSGATSGLAGAASGLAGGGFASRLFSGDTSVSEEDFRKEVAAHFALLEERLQRLEEQVSGPVEPDAAEETPTDPGGTVDPDSTV
jgi:hypothetical protein